MILQNFLKKKIDVLSQVLETLNFKDEISVRMGECNTPIKVTFYLGDPFYLSA
jgi:hypothetical protein